MAFVTAGEERTPRSLFEEWRSQSNRYGRIEERLDCNGSRTTRSVVTNRREGASYLFHPMLHDIDSPLTSLMIQQNHSSGIIRVLSSEQQNDIVTSLHIPERIPKLIFSHHRLWFRLMSSNVLRRRPSGEMDMTLFESGQILNGCWLNGLFFRRSAFQRQCHNDHQAINRYLPTSGSNR